MLSSRARALATVAVVLVALGVGPAAGGSADAVPRWAPLSTATIRPGVQMYTGDAQCTANFVFTDTAGNIYVGYAAHCAGTGSSSDTNGCTTTSRPLGTAVSFVRGGNILFAGTTVGRGTLVYSSWLSMQRLRTKDPNRCQWNDFALVKVAAADRAKVNPTVPYWGGPRTFGGAALPPGAPVYSVGNSSLRGGSAVQKTGTVLSRAVAGLGYEIKNANGIPGDSGSGFMDRTGRAVGVLSTLSVGLDLFGTPVRNTIGDLPAEVAWARTYSGLRGLTLAHGTQAFSVSGGVR